MIRSFFKAAFLLAAIASVASAAGRNFGVGLVFPAPTGFSAKLWTSGTTAIDFVIGWHSWYRDGYWDPACNNPRYYDRNRFYCEEYYYDYRDDRRYYGWRTFHIHADYLFHNLSAIRTSERFALFYGPGININWWRYEFMELGARGNFGIAWMPRRAPMDVFLEVAPVLDLFPYPDFDVNLGIGSRFYF